MRIFLILLLCCFQLNAQRQSPIEDQANVLTDQEEKIYVKKKWIIYFQKTKH